MKYIVGLMFFTFSIQAQGPVPFKISSIAEKAQNFHDSNYYLQTTGRAKNDSFEFANYMELDKYLDSLLTAANYMHVLNKYNLGIYYESVKDKEAAIKCYKEIQRFPFWGYYHDYKFGFNPNLSFNDIYFKLYVSSGHRLINIYNVERNLDALLKLKFVPASYNHLLPRLKSAIEFNGGEWPHKDMIFDNSHLPSEEFILERIKDPKNIISVDPPVKRD